MGLFVSRAGLASAKLRGKFVGAPGNTGQADQAAALIRGLQQTEVRRQGEGLVHVQGRDQLPRQQVAAGIAGDDQAEQSLVVKALLMNSAVSRFTQAVRFAESASL